MIITTRDDKDTRDGSRRQFTEQQMKHKQCDTESTDN